MILTVFAGACVNFIRMLIYVPYAVLHQEVGNIHFAVAFHRFIINGGRRIQFQIFIIFFLRFELKFRFCHHTIIQ